MESKKYYFSYLIVTYHTFLHSLWQQCISILIFLHTHADQASDSTPSLQALTPRSHLLPCLGAVGLASAVHGSLVLSQVDQRDGQPRVVGHVVVQQLRRIVHLVIKTPVCNLWAEEMIT